MEACQAREHCHDLVERDFARPGPNQLWVTDITEHPTREGKIYCCVVLDTYSRRVVGWSIDSSPTAALATNALGMAIDNRLGTGKQAGVETTIHSVQGVPGRIQPSSQHPLMSEVFRGGDGGLEQEDQRCSGGCASAVAC